MAQITKAGRPSLSSVLPPSSGQLTGMTAGEVLDYFAPVYISTTDGKVYNSTGAAAAAPAEVRGFVPDAHLAGDKDVTIYFGAITVRYGAGMIPGTDVFLSATAGTFSDVATVGGTRKLGFVVDATRIRLYSVQGK